MKAVIYLSDSGSGHLSRINVVLANLLPQISCSQILVRHGRNGARVVKEMSYLREFCREVSFQQVDVLVRWFPNEDGSPNLAKVKRLVDQNYVERSEAFIANEVARLKNADFIISDYVVEAFSIAKQLGCPSFGFMHFTWSWFLSKCYPSPLSERTLRYMNE